MADFRRQHAFQIFERCTLQVLIVSVKTTKCDLERLPWQHERQQCEYVRETLTGTRADEFVERRGIARGIVIEQAATFPDPSPDSQLLQDDRKDLFAVEVHEQVLAQDGRQGAGRLVPHVESRVVETVEQAIGRTL